MILTSLLAAAAQYPLEPIAFLPSTQDEQRLGESFAELGDVNGDGVSDFAVGSPGHTPTHGGWGNGLVEVYSGASGGKLYQVDPISGVDSLLGLKLAAIGDVNYDGANDFVIGCGGYMAAYVVSGRDGTRLMDLDTQSNGQVGMQLQNIGDLTGDGTDEIAIGLPNEPGNGVILAGRIVIFDGADGSVHYEMQGTEDYRYLGNMIAAPGDLNNDGIADFIVGGVDGLVMPANGGFTAINGANFQPLYSRDRVSLQHSTVDLDAIGDSNQDGINDFLVTGYQSHPNGMWFQGVTHMLSGANGSHIMKIIGDDFEDFGRASTPLGDMDGDGVDDIGVLSFQLNRQWQLKPTIKILSGKNGDELSRAATPGFNFLIFRLHRMSDINGDGRAELAVGVPENQVGIDPPNFLLGGELHILTLAM